MMPSGDIMITGPFVSGMISASKSPNITVLIMNMINPRSIKTSGIFTFQSMDVMG